MIGLQNPTCTDKYWNPVAGIDSMESRIQDCPGFPYLWRLSNKMLAQVGIMNHNKSHNFRYFQKLLSPKM